MIDIKKKFLRLENFHHVKICNVQVYIRCCSGHLTQVSINTKIFTLNGVQYHYLLVFYFLIALITEYMTPILTFEITVVLFELTIFNCWNEVLAKIFFPFFWEGGVELTFINWLLPNSKYSPCWFLFFLPFNEL